SPKDQGFASERGVIILHEKEDALPVAEQTKSNSTKLKEEALSLVGCSATISQRFCEDMSSPKAPRQSPASAARPGSRWLLAVLLCAIFSTHAFAGFTPAIPSLVIDLDSPVWSTNLTSNWLSRGELERWADILLDETSWTPSTFSKLRAALLPVSSLSQDPPSPRKQVPFAADPSLFRYNAIEERASTILGSSGVLVLDALADIADAVEPSSIVVAFEVSACAGIPTRRIHIDVSGCTETDLLASSASSPLKFGTSWTSGPLEKMWDLETFSDL
ncbi:hypothetical protein DFJ73DRAFT_891150, partial [Zopfochytrium polystomum]